MPQINWSHFKPKFTGKPDEDAKAHLLRINGWMDTHAFPEGVKVPVFLTNTSRTGKIMVQIKKAYKCRFEWVKVSFESNIPK